MEVYWLTAYAGGLFLPFKDETSGSTTYGAGRYLLDTVKGADLGSSEGHLVFDFNFAYNPSCSYDDRWACPLAPRANHLPVEVQAGDVDITTADFLLSVGRGVGENYLASDVSAFIEHTREAVELGQDQVVLITAGRIEITDFFGQPASTFKSIALMALEYRALLVVGYGIRLPDDFASPSFSKVNSKKPSHLEWAPDDRAGPSASRWKGWLNVGA